jgi:cbb3-type cytochrome oxidase maturation protein
MPVDFMSVVWILFVCSVVLLPGVALLALRWAIRQGEFSHLDKTALSIFDDEEPVGLVTDRFPSRSPRANPVAPHPPGGDALPVESRNRLQP